MLIKSLLTGISLLAFASAAAAQDNTSVYTQNGFGNNATIDNNAAGNQFNSSTVTQIGSDNGATVFQVGDFNLSFIQQLGIANSSTHLQQGNANNNDTVQLGDFHSSVIIQSGEENLADVRQDGASNVSMIDQGFVPNTSGGAGDSRPTDRNVANVDQTGAGLSSRIDQRAASNSGLAASDNEARIVQRSSGTSTSLQQVSSITQESRGNFAQVTQLVGSIAAPNSSTIIQRNSAAAGDNPIADNSTTVLQDGVGQLAQVTQDGMRNIAALTMQGGGTTAQAGNAGTITQTGTDLRATASFAVRGSSSTENELTLAQSGTGHSATTYQFGTGDTITITQENGVNTGAYDGGAQAQALADISQNASGFTATLVQTGDNFAEITQAFGTGSSVGVRQTDAGDSAGARTRNSALIAQYGNANVIDVDQDALGADAILWQRVGSSNNDIEIAQGEGRTGLSSTTGTAGFLGGPTGTGAIDLEATVTQGGSYNNATVYQDGVGLTANVEQNGTGTSALRNLVFISQTGSGNEARAFQGPGVGPSSSGDPASGNSAAQNGGTADEFYFPGGARSAELAILQTSTGNSAEIEQYGRGQFARIEQSGPENVAIIVQDATATNATAVIRQIGNNNSYSITQSAAGQYVVVNQTGSNNNATNVVTRP